MKKPVPRGGPYGSAAIQARLEYQRECEAAGVEPEPWRPIVVVIEKPKRQRASPADPDTLRQ